MDYVAGFFIYLLLIAAFTLVFGVEIVFICTAAYLLADLGRMESKVDRLKR